MKTKSFILFLMVLSLEANYLSAQNLEIPLWTKSMKKWGAEKIRIVESGDHVVSNIHNLIHLLGVHQKVWGK